MVNKIENAFYGKAKKKKLSSNEVVMSGSDKAEYDKGYKAGYGGQSAGSSSMDSWFYAGWTNGREDKRIEGYKNSFQNGVAKAEQEIMNKASQVGVKFKNAPGKLVEKYKGYGIRDYGSGNFAIWTSDGEGFAETGKKSIDEAKAWIDSNPHPKFHPGTRHSEGK